MASSNQWQRKTLPHGINACVDGRGTPMVLLPGWPQTVEAYAEVFPMLSQYYNVWVLDAPGLGDSAGSEQGYDTQSISRILHESLRGEIHEPYHLVGHDIGAWIAYPWASQFPDSLRSLTIMDAAIPGKFPPLSFPLPSATNQRLWQFSFNMLPGLPEILVEGRERELFDWLFDTKACHPDRISKARRESYVACYSKPGRLTHGFEYYRAIHTSAAQNEASSMHQLRMPVLALGGASGVGKMLKDLMSSLASNVEGGVIEDCGHYLMEEQSEAVAGKILEFCRSVDKVNVN